MLDIFEQYATDESLENNGTWFEIGGGAKVLVARSGNRAYTKYLTKEVQRYQRTLDREDDVAGVKSDEIMTEAMARHILLGWEGIKFKGEPLVYSFENAKKLLALKDFKRDVLKFADDMDAYKLKQEKEQGEG